MNRLFTFLFLFIFSCLGAQDQVYRTFKDTRVINTHSVEQLAKLKLDIRIGHRFGDLFGDAGGWQSFYGLENAADVLIGAEYGLTDNISIGLFRNKGAGNLSQLVNGVLKYRLLQQEKDGKPVTISILGVGTISTTKKNPDSPGLNRFPKFTDRMVYAVQFLVARKFSDKFSFQVSPGYVHRNLVESFDNNLIFTLGLAGRVQLTKVIGLVADFTLPLTGVQSPFSDSPNSDNYRPALGIGFEFDTGGHVFQVNITNSEGLMETDFIPYTTSQWSKGEFRLGFTISRLFNL